MAMTPARLSVKLELGRTPDFDPAVCVPIFHRWIQEKSLDELLIDVTDYRHVRNGPGLLLVGLEADYGVEDVDGRFGLRYTRKRGLPSALSGALLLAYRQAVKACSLLASDAALVGQLPSAHAGVEICFLDRLRYPNTPAAYPALLQEIVLFFVSIYGGSSVEARFAGGDARRPLVVRVDANPPDFDALAHRLDALATDRLTVLPTE